jgi:hypothetical protein
MNVSANANSSFLLLFVFVLFFFVGAGRTDAATDSAMISEHATKTIHFRREESKTKTKNAQNFDF